MMNNVLCHYGILGMKWGIRRYQNKDGSLTSKGKKRYSSIESTPSKTNEVILAKRKNKNPNNKDSNFDIYAQGKKVGDLFLEDHGDSLYVNWVGIKKSERGKGYASSVMNYVVNYGLKEGYKYATLEVPGESPDAHHIYKKLGFKDVGTESEDDVWGGLTKMRLDY